MIEHSHTGFEMTCVLPGSFAHAGGTSAKGTLISETAPSTTRS